MTHRVLFLHGLKPELRDFVLSARPAGFEVEALDNKASEAEKLEAIARADFLMIYRMVPSDAVLERGHHLKFLQLLAAGYDEMNMPLIHRLGIPCANNGGANAVAVADQAVLLILALYRRLIATDRAVRAGRWNAEVSGTDTFELADKTVGLIGFGNIARQVAKRVRAFDARVQYHSTRRAPPEVEAAYNAEYVSLDQLIETSDVVSLHVPLNAATKGLISRDRIARMKRAALLINTARGQVVDEPALIDALRDRSIAGAGLDAFATEPVQPDNPLLGLDNVVLSPHSAGTTADTWRRRGAFAFSNFQRILDGQAPEARIAPPAARAT